MDLMSPTLIAAIALIWSIGNTVALWLRQPGQDAQRAVEALREECRCCRSEQATRFADLQRTDERRLTEIETHLEHMPSSEEMSRLDVAIRELAARSAGMQERFTAMSMQLSRIEQYLLDQHRSPAGGHHG